MWNRLSLKGRERVKGFSMMFCRETSQLQPPPPRNEHMTFLVDKIDMWGFPKVRTFSGLLEPFIAIYTSYRTQLQSLKNGIMDMLNVVYKAIFIDNHHFPLVNSGEFGNLERQRKKYNCLYCCIWANVYVTTLNLPPVSLKQPLSKYSPRIQIKHLK